MPGILGEHVTLDATRGDTVDCDALVAEICSKCLDEANDGHLAAVVKRVVLDAQETGGDGAHQNDTTVPLEVFVGCLADKKIVHEC